MARLAAVGTGEQLQGPGSRGALVALWEGAEVGGLVGAVVVVLRGRLRLPLPAAAVVHEVGLQVPLAPVPDATRLAGEDVLWRGEHTHTERERERERERGERGKV